VSKTCVDCAHGQEGCIQSCIDCECARCTRSDGNDDCSLGAMFDRYEPFDQEDDDE